MQTPTWGGINCKKGNSIMDVSERKLFLFVVLVGIPFASSNNLVEDLFSNYSEIKTPNGTANNVSIRLEIRQIIRLDEKNQDLKSFLLVQVKWHEKSLSWDPTLYEGTDKILVPVKKIWTPDLAISNSAKEFVNEDWKVNFLARISHDGGVLWQFGGEIQTTCPISTKYYPFDKQECSIEFITWLHDVTMVDLQLDDDDIDTSQFTVSGEWHLEGSTCSKLTPFSYESEPEVYYPKVICTLFITRRPQFYIITILSPCLMLCVLTLMVFWLPPDSGEKMGFGVTILLSYSVFLLLVSEQLPHTATDLSLLSVYLICVMGICTLSIIGSTAVLYMHHKDSNETFGYKTRKLCNGLAKILCIQDGFSDCNEEMVILKEMSKTKKNILENGFVNEVENSGQAREQEKDPTLKCLEEIQRVVRQISSETSKKSDWVILAVILDRILFWITSCGVITGTVIFFVLT